MDSEKAWRASAPLLHTFPCVCRRSPTSSKNRELRLPVQVENTAEVRERCQRICASEKKRKAIPKLLEYHAIHEFERKIEKNRAAKPFTKAAASSIPRGGLSSK